MARGHAPAVAVTLDVTGTLIHSPRRGEIYSEVVGRPGLPVGPEPAHAVKSVLDEALRCKEAGEAKTILFNLSGHGHFDLGAYEKYLAGELQDYEYPAEEVEAALTELPQVEGAAAA